MADQLQLRGGTTAENSAFTGAPREVTVDVEKRTLVVHDGVTPGGNPMASASEVDAVITEFTKANALSFATVAEAVAAVTANPTLYTQVRIQELANSLWDIVSTAPQTWEGSGYISVGSKFLKVHPDGLIDGLGFSGVDFNKSHLPVCQRTSNPKIVFIGSSSFTFAANQITAFSSVPSYIQGVLVEQNPEKDFDFKVRSIGGQTFIQGNSKPTTFPGWYTDTGRDWLDYVEDEKPDAVFVGFGANDRASLSIQDAREFFGKLEAFTKKPDIVIVTHFEPSIESYDGDYTDQQGSELAAGWLRSYAKQRGYGLVDVNRMSNILRDGVDICRLNYAQITSTDEAISGAYTSPDYYYGYSASVYIPGDAATQIGIYNNTLPMTFTCGRRSTGQDLLFVKESAVNAGTIAVLVSLNDGVTSVFETGIPLPTTSHWLEVGVENNQIRIRIDRGSYYDLKVINIARRGGKFPIKFGYQGWASSPATKVNICAGIPVDTKISFDSKDLLSSYDSTGSTKLPYGGNGINHLNSVGTQLLVYSSLMSSDLRLIKTGVMSIDESVFRTSAPITVPSGTQVSIDFDTRFIDNLPIVDDTPGKWVVTESGMYQFTVSLKLNNNSQPSNRVYLTVIAANLPVTQTNQLDSNETDYVQISFTKWMNAGDKFYTAFIHSSGADLVVDQSLYTALYITRI